jgi:hypothetical protein
MFKIYQEEIKRLIQNVEIIKEDINKKSLELKELTQKNSELEIVIKEKELILEDIEKKYKNLLVGKEFASGYEGNSHAKAKINTLVREIDKCIALLND